MSGTRTVGVDYLARVEGEGAILIKIADYLLSDNELLIAEQREYRCRREAVREVREVVEQARRAKRAAGVDGEGLQVLLLVAEEHRHRKQQCAAASRDRGPAQLD